jgi:hypothetical protein
VDVITDVLTLNANARTANVDLIANAKVNHVDVKITDFFLFTRTLVGMLSI